MLWLVMRKATLTVVGLLVSALAMAQSSEFHRNNVTIGIGAAVPVGSDSSYLSTAPLVSIGYGYRFNRYFQADAGLQFAFGAANNQNAVQTDVGAVQGGDREYLSRSAAASSYLFRSIE
jgi:hypothetical protein